VFNTRRPPFNDPRARLAPPWPSTGRKSWTATSSASRRLRRDGAAGRSALRRARTSLAPIRRAARSSARAAPRFELLTVGSGEAHSKMLQARLNAVGFQVTIRQLELSTFQDR